MLSLSFLLLIDVISKLPSTHHQEKPELRQSNPALTAASEISSTHYNPSQVTDHHLPAPHLLAAYRTHHQGACGAGAQARGTSTLSGTESVTGVMHQYANKQGVKYYRDLAGNIKQVCRLASIYAFTLRCVCVAFNVGL